MKTSPEICEYISKLYRENLEEIPRNELSLLADLYTEANWFFNGKNYPKAFKEKISSVIKKREHIKPISQKGCELCIKIWEFMNEN